MKKGILTLALVIILMVTTFCLTGCSNNDENENVGSSNAEETIDNSIVEEENQAEEDTSKSKIVLVKQTFSKDEDEAVITLKDVDNYTDDDNYYVINTNGKIIYTFTDGMDTDNGDKYVNGYILINSDDGTYVKDLNTSEIIEQEDDSIQILDITKDGHILEIITVDELSGCTYYATIVDKNGTKVWSSLMSGSEASVFEILTDNYIAFKDTYSGSQLLIVDATDGNEYDTGIESGYYSYELLDDKIYIESGAVGLRYGTLYFDKNTKQFTQLDGKINGESILNENYWYYAGQGVTTGIYSIGEEITMVKDLSEGGVRHIYYKNNTYYIISDTGYYYTLNDSFEYVVKPTKINTDIYDVDYIYPTEYGILIWIKIDANTYEKYLISESDFRVDEDVTSKGNKFLNDGRNDSFSDSIYRYAFDSELTSDGMFVQTIYYLLDIENWKQITIHD